MTWTLVQETIQIINYLTKREHQEIDVLFILFKQLSKMIKTKDMEKQPIHKHDCKGCNYLDTITDDDYTFDLYFCTQGSNNPRFHTVIARYGEYGDYISGLDFADKGPLKRAKELAEEKGLL